jgi:hypothetical protein
MPALPRKICENRKMCEDGGKENLLYSICFNNQIDQEDEPEGLEREGL